MDRETARQEIRQQISCKRFLQKSQSGQYICPYCGSGTGDHKTGALKLYSTNTWHCFSCDKSGDVFDLYQQETGADYNTALSLLAAEIGINIDKYFPEFEETHNDYMNYYDQCRRKLEESPEAIQYLSDRGISLETAKAYWIGYDPQADPAGNPSGKEHSKHPCPRIIIPTSKTHYIGRSINPDTPAAYKKMNPTGSKPALFNARALYAQNVQEVFITEGAIDALSVIEIGAAAIGLNSTSNIKELLTRLEEKRTEATLIICLDNDEAGKKATEALTEGLTRLNISFLMADICNGKKDPNEALIADREAFAKAVEEAKGKQAKPDNTSIYIDTLMSEEIERFKAEKKTGFDNLDRETGGLYAGLYVLAAISSLGKTSFALQIADQLAAGGNDVIFFSLEQSRLELVSKSIARQTYKDDKTKAVTSLSIRKGYLPEQVTKAAKEYKKAVADRLSIVEGNFNCNISFIGNYVRQYIRQNKTRPVVFIDYLQILQPAEDAGRQTVREQVNTTVTELKRLSREQGITIIVISSVNRANYLQQMDFESLKESGGIEFTADVVMGLQLQCLNDDIFNREGKLKEKREMVRKAKAENPRKLQLLCLKNRYGKSTFDCCFNYYPANDLFTEDIGAEFEDIPDTSIMRM